MGKLMTKHSNGGTDPSRDSRRATLRENSTNGQPIAYVMQRIANYNHPCHGRYILPAIFLWRRWGSWLEACPDSFIFVVSLVWLYNILDVLGTLVNTIRRLGYEYFQLVHANQLMTTNSGSFKFLTHWSLFRANVWTYRESQITFEKSNFGFYHQNNPSLISRNNIKKSPSNSYLEKFREVR